VKTACIYARVSVDRDRDKASVGRQVEECRKLAKAKGFTVTEVFEERNLSAFKASVERPKWEALKAGIADGRYDALFGHRLDRLTRTTSEALKLGDLCNENGCEIVLCSGEVDTTTSTGRAFFQMSAVFAEFEAASTRDRLVGANSQAAKAGKVPSGGRRCYGYGAKGDLKGKVIPEEAAFIRMAVQDILSGMSLNEVCRRLTAAGSRTTMDGDWSPRCLKKLLVSPRLIGVRTHLGSLTEGTWEAILTEGEQATLVARLNRNSARYVPPSSTSTRHLLTGLVRCSECGSKMGYGRNKKTTAKGPAVYMRYQCKRIPGRVGCGRVAIAEPGLDAYVIATVNYYGPYFSALATPRRITLEDERRVAETALQGHREALQALRVERFRVGTTLMSDEEYAELVVPHEEAIQELTVAITRHDRQLDRLPTEKSATTFRKGRAFLSHLPGDINEQRTYLRQFLDSIVIAPAKSRGARFDSGRVELHWKSGEVTRDLDLLHVDNIEVE
jgi:DNA invertase Pin-like site-specific DNA recombinase